MRTGHMDSLSSAICTSTGSWSVPEKAQGSHCTLPCAGSLHSPALGCSQSMGTLMDVLSSAVCTWATGSWAVSVCVGAGMPPGNIHSLSSAMGALLGSWAVPVWGKGRHCAWPWSGEGSKDGRGSVQWAHPWAAQYHGHINGELVCS